MRSILVAVGLLLLGGCKKDVAPSPPAPAVGVPSQAVPAGGPTAPVTMQLELEDVSVGEAVRALATTTGTRIVIDPHAQELASCARITVVAPGPREPAQLIDLVGEALRTSGLRLERTDGGAVVRRDESTPPPSSCARLAAAATDDAEESPPAGRPSASETGGSDTGATDGIRRRGDREALITRAAVDAMFADQTQLMRQVRIIPQLRDGATVGVKLYGIRASSAVGRLGFRNGDLVTAINGRDISTPERALEHYAALRRANRFTVSIERGGTPVELRIRVVERLP